MHEMKRVTDPVGIKAVADLARVIWNQHFVAIIGQEQVDYMLDKFQSVPPITRQIADGYEYYLVANEDGNVGYFALVPEAAESTALLSKVYVRQDQRGRGLGRAIIEFAEGRCRELGVREMWLTVNKNNAGPIAFYEHMGFVNAECLVQDIGNGFVMDDYKMVKTFDQS